MRAARSTFVLSSVLLALLTLVPAPAQAARHTRKIQVFLVPMNQSSVTMSTKLGGLFERALRKQSGFDVADLTVILGGKPGPEVEAARKKARTFYDEGIRRYGAVEFDAAATNLEKAVALYREQAAWIDRIPEYPDALAYLGATYVLRGDQDLGRKIFKELVLYKKDYHIDPSKMDPSLEKVLERVRENVHSGSVGSMSVYSKPAGARIFIDGIERGFTPASLDRIPTGRHVLRLEHLGVIPAGEVVDVVPTEDKVVRMKLDPTPDFKKIQLVITEVGREIERGKVGPAMVKLGQFVGLDWAVYGVVTHDFGEISIDAWVVSIPSQRRLASRRESFPDSEFNLGANVDDFVKTLIKDASVRHEQAAVSDDPLDNDSGTEGWWDEGTKREKTLDVSETDVSRGRGGSDDPLEATDGTEDW